MIGPHEETHVVQEVVKMFNFYDTERRVLDAHNKVNEVSRNYRPELLNDPHSPPNRFYARFLGGLGARFLVWGHYLRARYASRPTVEELPQM